MRTLNILLIILLLIYLVIGGITIYHVYMLYSNPIIPRNILTKAIYPYELFEALCLAATLFSLNRLLKNKYTTGVYVAFAAVLLSGLFFAIHK